MCMIFCEVAEVIYMRYDHNPFFLMSANLGLMLDEIAHRLIERVPCLNN